MKKTFKIIPAVALTVATLPAACGKVETVDNTTAVNPEEDDAARAALGDKFRIPTDAEWTELINNCTWVWKKISDGYAANGFLVTGTNGNFIFLPAASKWNRYALLEIGHYWSSSLDTTHLDPYYFPKCAWEVYFDYDSGSGEHSPKKDFTYRCWGQSIRPVSY